MRRDRASDRFQRRRIYPLIGALLAIGAPGGWLLLRAAVDGRLPTPAFALREIATDTPLYGYMLGSTAIVFAVTGWVLGRKVDELRASASTDALTGLANRRAFETQLALELARRARYGDPLAVLLADLDGLKTLNDHFGHEAGDTALRAIAASLRSSCRRTDFVARFGGDEFVILAPNTSQKAAMELAERIRQAIHHSTPLARGAAKLTLSIGIAGAEGRGKTRAEELLAAADEALYEAKSAGRDRASLSGRPWIH